LQYPRFAEKLGQALRRSFQTRELMPCIAGDGWAHHRQEVARALPEQKHSPGGGTPALFVERDASGMMTLRRGFSLAQDQHVLVVEDVWTTGGSTQETITLWKRPARASLLPVR